MGVLGWGWHAVIGLSGKQVVGSYSAPGPALNAQSHDTQGSGKADTEPGHTRRLAVNSDKGVRTTRRYHETVPQRDLLWVVVVRVACSEQLPECRPSEGWNEGAQPRG